MGSVEPHIDLLRRWQPRVVLILDPAAGAARRVRQICPDAVIVGRVYRPDTEFDRRIQESPQAAADWAAETIFVPAAGNPEVDFWQSNNEVCQTSAALIAKLNTFSIHYIDALRARGLRAAVGCFSVGNPHMPDGDRMAFWREFYPAMRHGNQHGALLLLHAYGAPKIFDSDPDWYLYRYEKQVIPRLPNDLQVLPYLYGEYGADLGIVQRPKLGWRTGYNGNAAAYADNLRTAASDLARAPSCLGAAVFTLGLANPEWRDFDVEGDCANRLAAMEWPTNGTTPPSPPTPTPNVDEWAIRRGREIATISVAPGTALFDAIIRDGWLPNSPEVYERGPDGAIYALRSGESPDGRRKATYFALSGDWDNVRKAEA